jgi:hypothetical protein
MAEKRRTNEQTPAQEAMLAILNARTIRDLADNPPGD